MKTPAHRHSTVCMFSTNSAQRSCEPAASAMMARHTSCASHSWSLASGDSTANMCGPHSTCSSEHRSEHAACALSRWAKLAALCHSGCSTHLPTGLQSPPSIHEWETVRVSGRPQRSVTMLWDAIRSSVNSVTHGSSSRRSVASLDAEQWGARLATDASS
jgi:hypothetical protein